MEEAFDLSHEEFDGVRADYPDHDPLDQGQAVPADFTWFNAGFRGENPETSVEDDHATDYPHGTSMLSLLIGKTIGVVPQNRPILVPRMIYVEEFETGLRNIASHIEQRQRTRGEKRSPIVSMAVALHMSDNPGDPSAWGRADCVWAYRIAGAYQKLVDLGATVLVTAGNYALDAVKPIQPSMNLVIALGLGQRCLDLYGLAIPHVQGMHVVSGVDTDSRRLRDTHNDYVSGLHLTHFEIEPY